MVTAQNEAEPDLVPTDVEVTTQTGIFGTEEQIISGNLLNNSSQAFTNISIIAEAFDRVGDVIGEGFGYVVDECGTALLDLVLQSGESQGFHVPIELFDVNAEIAEVIVTAEGTATETSLSEDEEDIEGINQVTSDEVVQIEWLDDTRLRYGIGCAGDVFTRLDWYVYDLEEETIAAIEHPGTEHITEAFLLQTGLNRLTVSGDEAPLIFDRSFLTFRPDTRRIIYQNDQHTLFSSEVDGSYKRIIHERLHQYSLQGLVWIPNTGTFLAYYFGAYGEPVRYFTANVDGARLSQELLLNTASETVPGLMPDGLQAVIGRTFDDVTGYYLESIFYEGSKLLFEANLPGNNYPAPIIHQPTKETTFIYFIHPVDDVPALQCFQRETEELHTLTPVSLNLQSDVRGWSSISPDYRQIALAANGRDGGLWLIDLTAFEGCELEPANTE